MQGSLGQTSQKRIGALARAGLSLDDEKGSFQLLDYELFATRIFREVLSAPSVKGVAHFHPHRSIVWRSIMSFIKGSWEAINQEEGYLSLEQVAAFCAPW